MKDSHNRDRLIELADPRTEGAPEFGIVVVAMDMEKRGFVQGYSKKWRALCSCDLRCPASGVTGLQAGDIIHNAIGLHHGNMRAENAVPGLRSSIELPVGADS